MGTWGHKIMEDDFAVEVRQEYLEMLYDGLSSEEATDRLSAGQGPGDMDERSVFWLALAHTQLEYGRLTGQAREQALAIIQSGEDLERWEGNKKRQRVLQALDKKLRGPQKAPKKLVKRPPRLRQGDLFRFRIDDQRYGFGRVLTETERAIYQFTSEEKRPALEEVITSDVLFVVGSTDDGFARRQWHVIGNAPLEEHLTRPIYFFHQAVGDNLCGVYNIWDPEHAPTRKHIDECQDLEQWGAWSSNHIIDRVVAALEGKECPWIPRGRRYPE